MIVSSDHPVPGFASQIIAVEAQFNPHRHWFMITVTSPRGSTRNKFRKLGSEKSVPQGAYDLRMFTAYSRVWNALLRGLALDRQN